MQRKNQVSRAAWCILAGALLSINCLAQGNGYNAARTFVATAVSTGATLAQQNHILYHYIAWQPSGSPAACQVGVDTSVDGVTWVANNLIGAQTCTSAGASTIVAANAAFIRINVSSLTASTSVTVNYTGWAYNPISQAPPGSLDASFGYPGGTADPCVTVLANTTAAVNANPVGQEIWLGGFLKFFPGGFIPCLSNPWFKILPTGKLWFGATIWVTSQGWTTPGGNARFSWEGVGQFDPTGTGGAPAENSGLAACTAEVPSWNGTNACNITDATGIVHSVPAWNSTLSITFAYPHPPFQAVTIKPLVWWGGGGPAGNGTNNGGSFGSKIKNLGLWAGPAGPDVNYYNSGTQENSGIYDSGMRGCNAACLFFDRAQSTSTGPTHFAVVSTEMRMDNSVGAAASPGYPTVGSNPYGYGTVIQGAQTFIIGTGGGCITEPQAIPVISGGAIVNGSTVISYGGTGCGSTPTCTVQTNQGGSSATCTFGAPSGGIVPSITITAGGSGYSQSDLNGEGPYEFSDLTINGKNSSFEMEDGVYMEGMANFNFRNVHCEWIITGHGCLLVGNGNGQQLGGLISGVTLANSGSQAVHISKGGDKNVMVLATFTASSGGQNAVLDDVCSTLGSGVIVGPLSFYDPCSFYVASGSQNFTLTSPLTFNGTTSGSATISCNPSTTCTSLTTAKTINLTGGLSLSQAPLAQGTQATLTGTGACATHGAQLGGSWAGATSCSGTTGASTFIITPGQTASNGWFCSGSDVSTTLQGIQTGNSTTSCTLTFSSVTTGNTIIFSTFQF